MPRPMATPPPPSLLTSIHHNNSAYLYHFCPILTVQAVINVAQNDFTARLRCVACLLAILRDLVVVPFPPALICLFRICLASWLPYRWSTYLIAGESRALFLLSSSSNSLSPSQLLLSLLLPKTIHIGPSYGKMGQIMASILHRHNLSMITRTIGPYTIHWCGVARTFRQTGDQNTLVLTDTFLTVSPLSTSSFPFYRPLFSLSKQSSS